MPNNFPTREKKTINVLVEVEFEDQEKANSLIPSVNKIPEL